MTRDALGHLPRNFEFKNEEETGVRMGTTDSRLAANSFELEEPTPHLKMKLIIYGYHSFRNMETLVIPVRHQITFC